MSDQRPLPSATLKAFDQYKDKAPHNPGLLFDRFTLLSPARKLAKKPCRKSWTRPKPLTTICLTP